MAGTLMMDRTITRIETSPGDANLVFVVTANSDGSHVFQSSDGGGTWVDVDRGRLPNVPHHVAVIPPDAPTSLYVGSDAGVYFSPDLGNTWTNITRNLPNAMVIDPVYHRRDGTLTAETYGRSMWRIKIR